MAIKRQVQTFSLSIPLVEQVKQFSNDSGIPLSRICDAALREWMNKRGETLKTANLTVMTERE